MTRADALEMISKEIDRAQRLYGAANQQRSTADWAAAIAKQVGDAFAAVGAGSHTWYVEELTQIGALAVLALEHAPALTVDPGADGILELDRVTTPFPRVRMRLAAPPPGAVRVATAEAETRLYVGQGAVWVSPPE